MHVSGGRGTTPDARGGGGGPLLRKALRVYVEVG